ncbi:LysM peptidoglycan-binding domain-containing protein [Streptomyces sp. NPDC059556]|uniref:LysM peptidoglycan-binding domain-containing protein n=1 Tax=Streptomyces sp. NPDC059556 TaxID=3346863 RepID=UPI00368CE79E
MSTCRGIDISNYQGPQDWAKHWRDGVRFVWIKASEGAQTHDRRYRTHMTAARRANMIVGAYHFAWPNQSVAENAANYIDAVRADAAAVPGFVHWLDLEPYSDGRNYRGRSAQQIRVWAAEWVRLVQQHFPGQQVGVYAGQGEHTAGHVPAGVPLWFPAYPRVGMTYGEAERRTRRTAGGRAVEFWQFSGSPLDRSIAYMSAAELDAWSLRRGGPKPTPPKKPTPAPPAKGGRVWVVKAGQTLGLIAAALGVSVGSLAAYNGIRDPDVIHPGQRITAPPAAPAKPPAVKPKPKPTPSAPLPAPKRTYRVQPGDTLSGIATKYRTTVNALVRANGIKNPNVIFAGSVLRIPS